jgi:transketolase C-terminal domain/subunit
MENCNGKVMLNEGTDVTIIATGHLVWEALIAKKLEEKVFCRSNQYSY